MENQENWNSTKLNSGDTIQSYKFCGENHERESIKHNGSSSYGTPSLSPSASLTGSDSCVSGCSDFSVDALSYGRGYQEEGGTDSVKGDSNLSLKGHVRDLSLPTPVNGIHQSNVVVKNNLEVRDTENNRSTGRDAEIVGTGDNQVRDNGAVRSCSSVDEETGTSQYGNDEMDAQIWLPPEPEGHEDDMNCSVADYDDDDDDDDDSVDGMKWGKPSSLSSFGEEGSGSYRFKEEKPKAMDEVMNGKFKALVGQLLKSVGISSVGKDADKWVDIVTSLSWEAASFVMPDTIEGKAMDPDGYVKVKCIATGCRSQSQVIKGLVFKKHAAHKHMPTKYKNPRLLLIQGSLGLSSSELSSFESMEQEKDSLKSITEMIEKSHPNVVLVEKTVSRDIQESILRKGMTLVFDMKLHRLERVAQCTGSPILSSDILTGQNVRQCDSFHFEKFVEEHDAFGEGGKRPSKTLMFLEGCPTRLGCTILLKGTHSDELKRIKCVVKYAVVVAYHLILETYFLLHQRAMFSTIPLNGVTNLSLNDQPPSVGSSGTNVPCPVESGAETDLSTIEIPIINGFHEEGSHNLALDGDSSLSCEPYNPVISSGFSYLSTSLKRAFGDSFPLFCTSHQPMSTYFGCNGRDPDGQIQAAVQVSSSPEAIDVCDMEAKGSSDEKKAPNNEHPHSSSAYREDPSSELKSGGNYEDQMQSKDDISTLLDSESILVLMSRRNGLRGTLCEQSHFSHITFYRHFDIPLGKFFRDNLLNQRLQCNTCSGPSEAHFYYYAHHNKQLTIQIRRLPMDKNLPGETEGKLWMWSRCGKCKPQNGNSKSTRRVLISPAARGFSFGKFLELSLSNNSSFSRPSSCGHFLHRDFFYFFGLGPMVAMFRYSPVATCSVSLPPHKLEFGNSIRAELLREDFETVYAKGDLMFLEVDKSLKEIGSRFVGLKLNLQGSLKDFCDIEEMLKQERCQFEASIQSIAKNGNTDEAVYKLVKLNRVQWELLLESCLWDRRLYSLVSYDFTATDFRTNDKPRQEQTYLKENGTAGEEANGVEITMEICDEVFDNSSDLKMKLETSEETNDPPSKEIPIEGQVPECREQDESVASSIVTKDIGKSYVGRINANGSYIQHLSVRPDLSVHSHAVEEDCTEDNLPSSAQSSRIIPITKYLGGGVLDLNLSEWSKFPFSPLSNLENSKGGIWIPFPEIRLECMKDLQRGYLPKFEPINSHARGSRVHDLINEEGSRLHIPLGTDDYIVSDNEDELSSIVACALALLKDLPIAIEDGEDTRREKGLDAKAYENNSRSLTRMSSPTSSHWSSIGSLDSHGIHSSPSISSEESHSFDRFYLWDSVASMKAPHPEVFMGLSKLPGKGKYSVVCQYASQFRELQNRCCPSELDYIASISRCRNWDAKGGKSKSFFAKTLDDRFIIKEIKRPEYESFMKFAPDYFTYMNQCFEQGNQTCLAKILGIYQVITRHTKSGKDTKHDIMVMENLTFGRNITRQYDLKGALHARFNSAADGSGDVLLDQNFVNDMNVSPLYVSRKAKRILQRAVWNDTTFLNSINVMDYSLLVGVDSERHELVCGIIDYLRQYTWDKQLENWVKSSLVVPKNQLPTVISPKEYKKRFRKFITTHFSSVPDHWCSQSSSNPCKLCCVGDNSDSSHKKSWEQEDNDDDPSRTKFHVQGKQNGFSA